MDHHGHIRVLIDNDTCYGGRSAAVGVWDACALVDAFERGYICNGRRGTDDSVIHGALRRRCAASNRLSPRVIRRSSLIDAALIVIIDVRVATVSHVRHLLVLVKVGPRAHRLRCLARSFLGDELGGEFRALLAVVGL